MNRLGMGVLLVALASACHSASPTLDPPTLNGTWTSEEMEFPRRVVNSGGTFAYYDKVGSQWAIWKGFRQVRAAWSDSEGNRWFKTFDVVTENACHIPSAIRNNPGPLSYYFKCPPIHSQYQLLQRVSRSGETLEFEFIPVERFDEGKFPTELITQFRMGSFFGCAFYEKNTLYSIYHRTSR